MGCYQKSIWLCRSTFLSESPLAHPDCPGPRRTPPFQLHTCNIYQLSPAQCLTPASSSQNIPMTSFVRSSLNWAFAVSKSKSESNSKVVALEFLARSCPLLLVLDLRLPAEMSFKYTCYIQSCKQHFIKNKIISIQNLVVSVGFRCPALVFLQLPVMEPDLNTKLHLQ